jgi:hypothetical protein
MEAALSTVTGRLELHTNINTLDHSRKDDLGNLAQEVDTALKNLETRLLTTMRANIEAQKFEYTSRIEENNRNCAERINEIHAMVNKQDLTNQRK